MLPTRKIKKKGKFKAPCCDSPACQPAPGVAGADPSATYLDVIPEARALYQAHRTKRKAADPAGDEEVLAWKKHRETLQFPRQAAMMDNDDDDDADDTDSDGSNTDNESIPNMTSLPFPAVRVPRRRRCPSYREIIDMIDVIMKDFRLTDDSYREIMRLLDGEMSKGLQKDTHHLSTVRMYPTYVRSTPDGTENGRYLALDLGGTNFRVLLVDLKGREQPETKSQIFLIPNRIMLGEGSLLFDHIAQCISEFVEAEGLRGTTLPLGFTFSFPCAQDGLAAARLARWTKGFKCANVEGKNVVKLLHDAVKRRKDTSVECLAVINDPVGALMAAAHSDEKCRVGLILGTGTNCCYMEDLSRVGTWDGDMDDPKQVIVNTEWGAFGDNGVLQHIRNAFDGQLDQGSLNPGHQLFEKMISGMYMGELVRLVLCELTMRGLIFGGEPSEELFSPQRFFTKYISEIERDDPNGNFSNTKLVLQELDLPNISMDDCRHVQHVCWQVSQRAAFLAATAVATVINRLTEPEVTVAVDGSLYRFHPHFHDLMVKKVKQLLKPGNTFKLALAHDGSGIGAALVAAVAKRMRESEDNKNQDRANNPNRNVNNVDNVNNTTPPDSPVPDDLRKRRIIEDMNQ